MNLFGIWVFFSFYFGSREERACLGRCFSCLCGVIFGGRFFIEGLRTDSLMLTANLRAAQVVSALAIGIGLILIVYRHKKQC